MLDRIYRQGERVDETNQGKSAITLMQQTMRYDLCNGSPPIPDRDHGNFWTKGIGEICAFINGVTRADELAEFGADWWGEWTSPEKAAMFGLPEGDIGPASYGGAFRNFPTLDGGRFDQFQHLVEQINELPSQRVHLITPWMPAENARGKGKHQKNTIAPCHGWVHVRVINGRLHLHMYQRSGDTPVGVPSNMIQYTALLLMLEQLTEFEAGVYYHTISDAHMYSDQESNVLELLKREPLRLPTMYITEEGKKITKIHDFRRGHFGLRDYYPHPAMRIPVST